MKAISSTIARKNLTQTMNNVCKDHDPVIITRKNDKPVVMLSLEDYEFLNETAYLFCNPRNAIFIEESIEELKSNKGLKGELPE